MAGTNATGNAKVYAGDSGNAYDVTQFFRDVTLRGNEETPDKSTLADADRQFEHGHMDGGADASGLYSDGSTELQAIMEDLFGVKAVWVACPLADTAVGDDFLAVEGTAQGWTDPNPLEDMVPVDAVVASDVGLDIGRTLHPLGNETSAEDGTSLDNAAATSAGGAAYFICTAFTGTNVVVEVEDSADDAAFASIASATFTAPGAQRVDIAAATDSIDRYTRYAITGGTFSSADLWVGIVRYAA